jgi:hypothetical protein
MKHRPRPTTRDEGTTVTSEGALFAYIVIRIHKSIS